MNVDALVGLLRGLQSADNGQRNAAETQYNQYVAEQPALALAGFAQIVSDASREMVVREHAAVFLWKILKEGGERGSAWCQLGGNGQRDMQVLLLKTFQSEASPSLRRKVADVIHTTATETLGIQAEAGAANLKQWPDLLPTLMNMICDTSREAAMRADALLIVKQLVGRLWQLFLANSEQTVGLLSGCLMDTAVVLRGVAAEVLLELVESIPSKKDRAIFGHLRVHLAPALCELAAVSDTLRLQSLLESLQPSAELAEFLKDSLAQDMVPVLTKIAKSHPDDGCRRLALEVLVSFVEIKPKTMVKVDGFLLNTFETCLEFIGEVDDDIRSWENAVGDAEDGETDKCGRESLDRVCRRLHEVERFDPALEILQPMLAKCFQTGHWKHTLVGVVALAQISEFMEDEAMIAQMAQAICAQLSASNSRVRYVAWSAVAQLSVDHPDSISGEEWVTQLMPCFISALDDPCSRVLIRSIETFPHYGENVEREDMEAFVPTVMQKLGAMLQHNSLVTKMKVITFVAVLARQMEDGFATYYDAMMPLLKDIVAANLHKVEERSLLGKAFECMSLLAKTVGRARFVCDAEVIMEAMITAAGMPNLPPDDPVKEYVMSASERICSVLKEDFVRFLPHVLPGILAKLTTSQEGDSISQKHDDDEVHLGFTKEGGKVRIVVMSTSEVEDLQNALDCVHTFVEVLEKAYAPFIAQSAQAVLPVLAFTLGEGIRCLAFETWGLLVDAARQSGKAEIASELMMELLKRVLPSLETSPDSSRQPEVDTLRTAAEGIKTSLQKAGPGVLTREQVAHISNIMMQAVQASFERTADVQKQRAAAAADGDDSDMDFETPEKDDVDLRITLCDVIGGLMLHHADFVAPGPIFDQWLSLVQRLLQPASNADDFRLGLLIAVDFLEQLGGRIDCSWPLFMPQLLHGISHSGAEIRQAACYGISVAAARPAFAECAAGVAQELKKLVVHTRQSRKAKDRIAQAAADNALWAMMQILEHHHEAVSAQEQEIWNVWLGALPCQEDDEEGKKVHKVLLQLAAKLVRGEPTASVDGARSLAQAVRILVDIYKTDMADDETSMQTRALLLALGEARCQELATGWKEKQQRKLVRILRDANVT